MGLKPPGLRNVTIILPIWSVQLVADWCHDSWVNNFCYVVILPPIAWLSGQNGAVFMWKTKEKLFYCECSPSLHFRKRRRSSHCHKNVSHCWYLFSRLILKKSQRLSIPQNLKAPVCGHLHTLLTGDTRPCKHFKLIKGKVSEKNIARGTTDPGFYNLNYLSSYKAGKFTRKENSN